MKDGINIGSLNPAGIGGWPVRIPGDQPGPFTNPLTPPPPLNPDGARILDDYLKKAAQDEKERRIKVNVGEADPNGYAANKPGAKLDAGKNRVGLMVSGFSKALAAVAEVTTFGANKYTPNGWKEVPNGIDRYTDALYRHLLQEAGGESVDQDSKLLHAAHTAWNALARLELMLKEKSNGS